MTLSFDCPRIESGPRHAGKLAKLSTQRAGCPLHLRQGLLDLFQRNLNSLNGLCLSGDALAVKKKIFFHLLPDQPDLFVDLFHKCTPRVAVSRAFVRSLRFPHRPGALLPESPQMKNLTLLALSTLLWAGCSRPIHYVASKNSQVFHRSSCGDVGHIKPDNLEQLGDDRAAAAKTHRPCEVCKP